MKPALTMPRRRCACAAAAVLTTLISADHHAAAAELPPAEAVIPASANAMSDVADGLMSVSGHGMSRMNDMSGDAHNMNVGTHAAVPAGVFGGTCCRQTR
ncbi:hypothetical protein [Methylocapsa aurea]|uniref:hypothetical protein n=1 Tax=Methylocapsa aurea TaxID=663610 RepID=UPI00055A8AE2|nr:hypothetical protein [Methylocapsa aurea]